MIHGLNLCQPVKILLENSCSLCPHRRKESQPQLASNGYNQYVYSKVPEKLNKKSFWAQVLSSSASVWMANCYTEAGCVKAPPSGCNSGWLSSRAPKQSAVRLVQLTPLCSSVQQPTATVQQPTATVQQPTSAVQLGLPSTAQSQHWVIQLDSSSFLSSMFNGLSNCTTFLHSNLMWIFTQSSEWFE